MTEGIPGFFQAPVDATTGEPAKVARMAFGASLANPGVMGSGDLLVSHTTGMGLQIEAGAVGILGLTAPFQGSYIGWNDGAINRTAEDADGTMNRIDIMVAHVYDAEYSGASSIIKYEIIKGDNYAPGHEIPPPKPPTAELLAHWTVAAGATSISGLADDRRYASCRGAVIFTPNISLVDTTNLMRGQIAFDLPSSRYWWWNGAIWVWLAGRCLGVQMSLQNAQVIHSDGNFHAPTFTSSYDIDDIHNDSTHANHIIPEFSGLYQPIIEWDLDGSGTDHDILIAMHISGSSTPWSSGNPSHHLQVVRAPATTNARSTAIMVPSLFTAGHAVNFLIKQTLGSDLTLNKFDVSFLSHVQGVF